MAELENSTPNWMLLALGMLTAAAGVYFGLVGFQLVPSPSRINGPIWIALFVGLVFFSAGIAVIVRGALGGPTDGSGEVPENTPVWANIVYWLSTVLAATGLASIGTWVAFGGGTRQFSISGFISGPLNETIGRGIFGIGAIITWLMVLVFAHAGAKKIFGKNAGP